MKHLYTDVLTGVLCDLKLLTWISFLFARGIVSEKTHVVLSLTPRDRMQFNFPSFCG